MRSRYARHAATKSPTASPPNFSCAARASSHATAASATTASASTAATSERSTSASAASPVARSTEPQRLHQRRQRLHRGAHDELLAVRDAALEPARVVRLAAAVGPDLVVRLRAAQAGEREPVADLDALHGLDAHHRGGEPRVEAVLLRGVRAEPRRDVRARTSTMPPTVSRSLRASSIARAQALLVDGRAVDLTPIVGEQRLRDAAGGDVHGGVPRRRALERVADVVEVVLEHAGEVGVAGPRQRDRLHALPLRLALGRPRVHPPRPVLVVAVADDERERRAERPPWRRPASTSTRSCSICWRGERP